MTCVFAAEYSDSFIIKINEGRVKVLSPKSAKGKTGLIIENNTLERIYARVEAEKKIFHQISIMSGKSKSVFLDFNKHQTYNFLPLAPAFQTIYLTPGRSSYEIPSKK